jgi:hypothetical protein
MEPVKNFVKQFPPDFLLALFALKVLTCPKNANHPL